MDTMQQCIRQRVLARARASPQRIVNLETFNRKLERSTSKREAYRIESYVGQLTIWLG